MPTIDARVQENEWVGHVAADGGHDESLDMLLRRKRLLSEGEYVVSISMWVGENFGGKPETPEVTALVADGVGYANIDDQLKAEPLRLREVQVPMGIEEFIGSFKRFKLVLAMPEQPLFGRDYEITNPPEHE